MNTTLHLRHAEPDAVAPPPPLLAVYPPRCNRVSALTHFTCYGVTNEGLKVPIVLR